MAREKNYIINSPHNAGLLEKTISNITPTDAKAQLEAQARLDNLTKPLQSLGRLEELAKQIASITGTLNPDFQENS